MEENKKVEEVEVKKAGIDPDVLDIMKQKDILDTLKDEKFSKRAELNFFAEMLSSIKDMNNAFGEFMNFLTMVSADKLKGFFKELQNNVEDEETRVNLQEKMKKSHLKAKNCKKSAKNDNKSGDLSKKSVK